MLGLLATHGGELSGYDLHRCAQSGVAYVWAPARSRIYATLPRLVAAGLAQSRDVVQRGRPDKQLYRITARGRRALLAWLESPSWRSEDEFLLRLFFGDLLAPRTLDAHLEAYAGEYRGRLATYRGIEEQIRDEPRDRYGLLALRLGLALGAARVRWAAEARRALEAAP